MLKNDTYHISLEKNNDKITIEKFNETHQYIILEQINDIPKKGHAVLNHLYVNPGFEENFKHVFLNRDKHLKNIEGFENLLFLKPYSKYTHYIIVTIWTDENAFINWQKSKYYKDSHKNRGTKKGVDQVIVNRNLSFKINLNLFNSK